MTSYDRIVIAAGVDLEYGAVKMLGLSFLFNRMYFALSLLRNINGTNHPLGGTLYLVPSSVQKMKIEVSGCIMSGVPLAQKCNII